MVITSLPTVDSSMLLHYCKTKQKMVRYFEAYINLNRCQAEAKPEASEPVAGANVEGVEDDQKQTAKDKKHTSFLSR